MDQENGSPILLSAAFVAPMDAEMVRDGALVMERGRILAIGSRRELCGQYPMATIHDFPDAILTPGLVNAHVHLELSDCRQGERPASFVQWLLDLMAGAPRSPEAMAPAVAHAVTTGVSQCLRFGVSTVGDISKQCMFTRPALREGPLRVVSFGELQAMAQRRGLLEERFAVAADITHESERLRVGISPHAPYTVEPAGYRRCLDFARMHHRPLATHLAENPDESAFLSQQTGPFRYLWETGINAWDERVPRYAGGPIRFAREMGLLEDPTLLAHVNYCDDEELAILATGRASVVYCPRTHAYFGHPPHRWRDMLAAGINLAIGTDSCASSPDLNLLDDLRLLRKLAPDMPAIELWRLATIAGAGALQMQTSVGSLTAGKRADVLAFTARSDDPLAAILDSRALPRHVWIDGRATS